ncbi:aminotransferase class III-fold pyridoxal phosphate-dependent enzyme [Mesorhizobium sp.]|uniref:aminotransferase class III-fold pyridoxal phosphate-dependent enzyme n=1 Tax=Mesorhizobium sp. TaxID=1871066 RepID=UPI00257E2725|nr:aminotransferase class III-fold pyridoxal phosphate-dependent enzyme [Mesorhizobium sp.]
MLSDEVVCGFGGTGNWFGSQTFGMESDMLSIAKGLSSGHLPIGGVIISTRFINAPLTRPTRSACSVTVSPTPVIR